METALQKAANAVWTGLQGIATVTPAGLDIRQVIDLDDFTKAFNLLLFLDDKYKVFINFALGDLYNALNLQHGDKKAQITDTWGEGWYNRLATLGQVAKRIPKFSRQNYELAWHVYEAASPKYLPDDVRATLLQTAAAEKKRGKFITRATIRESVDCYKPAKKPGPRWNNGEGGGFGDAADREPPQAPVEPDTQSPANVTEVGSKLADAQPSPHTTYALPAEPVTAGDLLLSEYDQLGKEYSALATAFSTLRAERDALKADVERLSDTMASWADNQISLPDRTLEELRKRLGKYMLTHTESDWGISEFADYTLWKEWRPR